MENPQSNISWCGRSNGRTMGQFMNYVNVKVADLKHPNFIGAEPIDRATWLCLLAYCCEQENGGVIQDCRGWNDRLWIQACGVTAEEVGRECALWRWDGDSLVVWAYPVEQEQETQRIRKIRKEAGQASGKARKQRSLEQYRTHVEHMFKQNEQRVEQVFEQNNDFVERKEKKDKIKKDKEKKDKETDALAHSEAKSELDLQDAPLSADKKALSFVSVPSWDEIQAFCERWPGEPSTGIPPQIPLAIAAAWIGWYNGKREKPADWQQSLVCWYRRSFIESRQATINLPKGALSAADKIGMRKDLERIERRIDEIRDKAHHYATGIELTEEQKDEIRRLQARRKEIMDALGMVA
jgi:hypothetical protein